MVFGNCDLVAHDCGVVVGDVVVADLFGLEGVADVGLVVPGRDKVRRGADQS